MDVVDGLGVCTYMNIRPLRIQMDLLACVCVCAHEPVCIGVCVWCVCACVRALVCKELYTCAHVCVA